MDAKYRHGLFEFFLADIGYFALRYIRRNRVKEWFRSRIGDGMRDIAQL